MTIENAIGGSGADTITGNEVNNRLEGGAGDDKLDGRAGADVMIGGTGYDEYWVDTAPTRALVGFGVTMHYAWVGGDQVIEQPNEGWDLVHSSVSYTLPDNVEALTLTGSADLNGYGNDLDNVLYGNDGANRLEGYAGDDVLDGRGGADVMIGGAGDDTYRVDTTATVLRIGGVWRAIAGDQVIEKAGEGHDSVIASVSYTLPDNVEDLMLDSAGGTKPAIDGWGNARNNVITGNDAANKIYGLAGDDYIDGKGGDDLMIGGTGDDTYVVDAGPHREIVADRPFIGYELLPGDQVVENAGEGHDTVFASVSYTLPDNVEDLLLVGNTGLTAIGNALANVISGSAGGDLIDGRGGGDLIFAGGGDDRIMLHDGDVANGGSGNDLFELAGFGTGTPYHAGITDLEAGDAIRWHFDTPIDGGDLHFVSALGAGTGEATGLDHVEMYTADGHTILCFGFDANPGADFVLSLDGGFDPAQLRVDDSQGATLTIDVMALARGGHDGFAPAFGTPFDAAGAIDDGAAAGDAAAVDDVPSVDHVVLADDTVPVGDVALVHDGVPANDPPDGAASPDQPPLEDGPSQQMAGDFAAAGATQDATSEGVSDAAGAVATETAPETDQLPLDADAGDLTTWDNAGTDLPPPEGVPPGPEAGDPIGLDNASTDLAAPDAVAPDADAGDLIAWDNAANDLPAPDPAADPPVSPDGGTGIPASDGAPPATGPADITPSDTPALPFNHLTAFHPWEMMLQSHWHLPL